MADELAAELRARHVYDVVRRGILRGDFELNTPISQVKLAEQLGVSRTPLREALRMLQREGLIEAEPNRRVRVAPLSISDLEEVYAHRIVLEALALSLSVPHFTDVDFAEIRGHLETMHRIEGEHAVRGSDPADVELWQAPHRDFHAALRRYAGTRITHYAIVLSDHSERYRRVYLAEPAAWAAAGDEHEAIVQACEARDVAHAYELMSRHLARTALSVVAKAAPEHDPSKIRVALQLVIGRPSMDDR